MLDFLDFIGIHVHWHEPVFPEARYELNPYRQCRCGHVVQFGDPMRWYINLDGEWEYDDNMYSPP